MYCSVVHEREGEVVAYLRWVRGSGKLMPRHAGTIANKHLGQQQNYAALSPGGSYVLVWGLGGGFQTHSQKTHLIKETLQESTLSKGGALLFWVGGWGVDFNSNCRKTLH